MPLADNLRREREAAHLSRAKLSDLSGVSQATIARVELEGHTPKLGNLSALALALGVPLGDLLNEDVNGGTAVA